MSSPDPDRAPIFVVGTGRSGTTLLRLMLNAHPRIYLTHEASFYAYAHLLKRRMSASDWLEAYMRSYSFAWLCIEPELVRRELPVASGEALPRERLTDAFRAVMRAKGRTFGRPRYGDKSPFHSGLLKPILRDFPEARVIHIVRDPRATVASLHKMPWASGSWLLNNWYCRFQLAEVRPFRERICEVRLEDLLRDPRGEMQRILEYVGEPWDEAVLDHVANAPKDDTPPFPWLLGATQERGTQRSNWRTELSPEWVRMIERRNKKGMARYGYEKAKLADEPSLWSQQRAALRDLPEAARFLGRFFPVVLKLLSLDPPDPAEAQRRWLSLNPGSWQHYPGVEIPDPPRWRS